MSQNDPNTYDKLSTKQLEDLLQQPGLTKTVQELVQEELTQRYTEDLLKGKKAASPPPAQAEASEFGPPTPKPVPPPEPLPTVKAKRGRGCSWIGILIIIAVVLYYMLNSTSSSSYGVCNTYAGTCPMLEDVPKGLPCQCNTSSGTYYGVVQ